MVDLKFIFDCCFCGTHNITKKNDGTATYFIASKQPRLVLEFT